MNTPELPSQSGVQSPGQMDLLPPGESDAAFFLSSTELRKRYTAAQAREVEGKRELILMCIAAGFQWDYIAEKARVSYRTVTALAARDAEKVAGNLREFGLAIRSTAARWYGLARGKENEATFIQLAQAASFALQRSNEIEVIAGMGEIGEKDSAIASAPADPCARLRQLLAPKPAGLVDATSGQEPTQPIAIEQNPSGDAVRDAGDTPVPANRDQENSAGHEVQAGGAGGSEAEPAVEKLDTSERAENFGKGIHP